MHKLVLRRIGRSLGVTLPPEMVEEMGLAAGDTLFLVKREDGYAIVRLEDEAMRVYHRGAAKYRNALRDLAG